MNKKIILLVILLGFEIDSLFAQCKEECEKIVAATVDAINNKSPEQLEKYLAPDFTCAGQKGEIAIIVLNQLIPQLNDNVTKYEKISETEDGDLTIVYEFVYFGQLGKQPATFVFNKENQLKQLELIEIQVQTAGNENITEKPEQEIINVPIKLEKNLITVQAKVNGVNRTFIVDNGAPCLVLNSKYTAAAANAETGQAQGVNSSVSYTKMTPVEEFDFYGIKIKDKEIVSMDISNVEEECGIEIYGLIGYDVYNNYDLLFDYANNTLTLINPDISENYVQENFKNSKTHEISIEIKAHIAILKGTVGKQELNLGLDCGASGNLLNIELFDTLKTQLTDVGVDDLSGAGESKKDVTIGKINELIIGDTKFQKPLTVFNDMSHLNTGYNLQLDGLIGYEILSKQKTLLSYQNKKLIFIE
ncbi:MAG: aspartyl protease family protein [Prevotellaceae bacterium]|jgi:hypothetical protein|nr:aspartyl protease family protein [Prevotellaceae bacterium]